MAAPSYVQASTGATDATGAFTFTGVAAGTIGDAVIVQVLVDGTGAISWGTLGGANINNLAGSAGWTEIGAFFGGAAAQQRLFIGRRTSATLAPTFTTTANTSGDDVYGRMYEFTDVSTGTTLATVIENVTAGATTTSGVTTSATASDAGVTTIGSDRLALNFVGVNDDNAISAFTGETGGDWALAVAGYADSGGTDGAIALQVSTDVLVDITAGAAGTGDLTGAVAPAIERRAQSFTAANSTGSLTVTLGVRNAASPTDDLVIQIQTDSAGSPSETVLASTSIAASDLTTSIVNHDFVLSPGTLTAGTKYWIVVARSGALDATNKYAVQGTATAYADGEPKAYTTAAGWAAAVGSEFSFKIVQGAHTIDGGTGSIVDSDAWGVVGFALIGTTVSGTTYTKAGYGKESA